MLNKQICEIETGKLLAKNPLEKWVEGITFFVVAVFFQLPFVFVVAVVAVVVVCLLVSLFAFLVLLVGFSF